MNNSGSAPGSLGSKQHFELLDGLRGVAAVSVVIFHFMEIAVPDYEQSFIAHAYLAVDFFFCLSGFVIAYAYDNRLKAIGAGMFFKLRLIRLHPLVIVGSVIGVLMFVFDPFSDLWRTYSDRIWLMFGSSCLMIPYPIVKERWFNLFHLNPPAWSLFWEYVANIFYAFVLIRVGKKLLWVLVAVAAVILFFESNDAGNLAVGWSGENFGGGAIRVFYSFLVGILIYRLGWILKTRLGFIGIGILLMIGFLYPFVKKNTWIVDPVIVAFWFPLVVALGAGGVVRSGVRRLCKFCGDISYPLYMVHYPFIWLFMSYVEKYKPSLLQMSWITGVGTMLLIGLAYVIMVYVDEPVRNMLKNRMKRKLA